ncbi:MAG: HEAT repeat domain-containing protein [Oscillatoriales cyanobacterium RM2_1_1]|nr:HEAT repeat domain-containing protein [Oscillatoriales cyanobacterium SM2_3_0]NJO46745.1 HEAT repeat domain-containing protein [Oscillatoriales cyanobacterium RM2_1_1]
MSKPSSEFSNREQQTILEAALESLESGDFQERWEAAKAIAQLGEFAINPLVQHLTDDGLDPEARWFMVRILGQLNSAHLETVVLALVGVLQTIKVDETAEEAAVREMAAIALANLGQPAIAVLVPLLETPKLRGLTTQALAQMRHPETIGPLLQVVADPDPGVRAIALEALGNFQHPEIPAVLIQGLQDSSAPVRKEAVTALGLRSELETSLQLTAIIQPLLWDVQADVVQQAQIALSRYKTPTAARALFEQLSSHFVPLPIKLGAIRALGWFETGEALEYLEQFLSSLGSSASTLSIEGQILLGRETIQVIGRTGEPDLQIQAVAVLISLLDSKAPVLDFPQIKQQIAWGLGHLGHAKALEPLFYLLAEPHTGIRLHCITALKQLATPQTYEYLQEFARQQNLTPGLQQGISLALAEW